MPVDEPDAVACPKPVSRSIDVDAASKLALLICGLLRKRRAFKSVPPHQRWASETPAAPATACCGTEAGSTAHGRSTPVAGICRVTSRAANTDDNLRHSSPAAVCCVRHVLPRARARAMAETARAARHSGGGAPCPNGASTAPARGGRASRESMLARQRRRRDRCQGSPAQAATSRWSRRQSRSRKPSTRRAPRRRLPLQRTNFGRRRAGKYSRCPVPAGNSVGRHRRRLHRRMGAQKPRDRGHRGRRRQRAVTTSQCRRSRQQVQARGIARGGVTTAGGLHPSTTAPHPTPVRSACSLPPCSGSRAHARTAGAACCAPHARSGTAASRYPHRRCL